MYNNLSKQRTYQYHENDNEWIKSIKRRTFEKKDIYITVTIRLEINMAIGHGAADWKIRNSEWSWLNNLVLNKVTDRAMTVAVGREFQGRKIRWAKENLDT